MNIFFGNKAYDPTAPNPLVGHLPRKTNQVRRPAEIAMFRTLGADAVGMSTVPEIIALRHMRIRAAAISCITNLAAGLSKTGLDHAEVEATAMRSRDRFVALVSRWVVRVGEAALGGPPSGTGFGR